MLCPARVHDGSTPVRRVRSDGSGPAAAVLSACEAARPHADGRYSKLLTRLNNSDLLLLDDWGLEPLSSEQRSDLLEIVDLMYQRGSIIVVSQLPVENWYKMIGDSTHADAILDRLVHGSIKIELKGESMRKIQSPLTEGDQ